MITVMIVDDHPLMCRALANVIASEGDFDVVGQAYTGEEALALYDQLLPDVVVMDILLPGMDGMTAARLMLEKDKSVKIMLLTSSVRGDRILTARRIGVLGYSTKDESPDDLLAGIRSVAQGAPYMSQAAREMLVNQMYLLDPANELTDRERDVSNLVAVGLSNAEIAVKLNISESTVRTHVHHILAKLNMKNRMELVLMAKDESDVRTR